MPIFVGNILLDFFHYLDQCGINILAKNVGHQNKNVGTRNKNKDLLYVDNLL